MKQNVSSTRSKISIDLFSIQMKWSSWFIAIVFAIYLIVHGFVEKLDENFISFIFRSSKIYMLIIGIVSCFAFLTYFVKNGITRKDYYTGSVIAATLVGFSIMLIATIITSVLTLIETYTTISFGSAYIHFVEQNSSWLLSFVTFSLIIISYYVAGWIIALGFYRFGGWGGFGSILIAILYMSLTDLLWEGDLSHPLAALLKISKPTMSLPSSILGTLLLLGLGLFIIRKITKRIPIKLE
ncbi:hypothetical protein BKP37_15590 [Anaerobacillus alkalilacustris]|uniref:Uncharacterized protein n=1 Tax=Anaerobacillus alkalilacustris TaxID=393763 RepID=A0A1S2LG19_9BACI|nr:hypothetical protein [Anaerobacillus alkalilacustris]OIJ11462.1 hypothetical protein BKP37_15590 [Anaerobacillus alkalilacustris]